MTDDPRSWLVAGAEAIRADAAVRDPWLLDLPVVGVRRHERNGR